VRRCPVRFRRAFLLGDPFVLSELKLICNQRLLKSERIKRERRKTLHPPPLASLKRLIFNVLRYRFPHARARACGAPKRAIAICNKWAQIDAAFFDTLISWHAGHAKSATLSGRARRIKVKKIVPFVVAAALGLGLAGAAEAHVSVGIGIGVPVAPAYPIYAAPPPVYYAPPPPVVYAPPPVVVGVGGYYGGYGRPYYPHGYYRGYGHGYYGHGYYRR
jgi:hypothetical protein